jgi:hypothetical protein
VSAPASLHGAEDRPLRPKIDLCLRESAIGLVAPKGKRYPSATKATRCGRSPRLGCTVTTSQDHSMLAAMTTVDNMIEGRADKSNIWATNNDEEYHEEKKA